MNYRICWFGFALILMACGQRKDPPAPVFYGTSNSKRSEDSASSNSIAHSETMLTYVDPRKQLKPISQKEQTIVVQSQENLDLLADRYQIDRNDIIARNKLMSPYYLFPGQHLKLPATARARPTSLKKSTGKSTALIETSVTSDTSEPDDSIVVFQKKKKLKQEPQHRTTQDREQELHDKFSRLESDLQTTVPTKSLKKREQKEDDFENGTPDEGVKIPAKKPESLAAKNKNEIASNTVDVPSSSDGDTQNKSEDRAMNDQHSATDVQTRQDRAKIPAEKTSEAASFTLRSPLAGPIKERIVSDFNQSTGKVKNDGINIKADKNTSILAAQSGQVVYAGNEMQGFGNLILLKHENGWMTAYGHCAEILVKEKQVVKQGDVIAKVGNTGSVRDPQLHFQLRKKSTVIDPKLYLE